MNKLKSCLNYLLLAVTFVVCILGIPFFFYNSDFLSTLLSNSLHLKITPSYIGGEITEDFFDDANDDNGSGILRYPSNSEFNEGSLDLVRYTVHKPVYEAKWQQNAEYWQLDLEYKSGPAEVKNIMVYIDIDNDKQGSTETLVEGAENVTFTEEHPWDFAIHICNEKGKVYNSKKEFLCNTELSNLKDGKQLLVRIPLQKKELQKIYTSKKTYHYVLTSGYSEWDRGNILPIEKRRTVSRGGVTKSSEYNSLVPKTYDILDDSSEKKFSQQMQLSSFNKEDFTKATLYPVEVTMNESNSKKQNDDLTEEIISKCASNQKTHDEQNKLLYEDANKNPTSTEEKLNLAILAFNVGETDKAETLLAEVVKEQPENYLALAYYGSCVATRGGNSSVVQAVKLVNDSYIYLDKAVELSENKPEEIDVLMNRASVSKAVPNAVFGKAITGAEDFTKCANLYKKQIDMENPTEEQKLFLAYLYASASECYKTAGKETEQMINLKEAEKLWK